MKCFLDDDYEPPENQRDAFQAGQAAERAHANSPEEIARWKQHADETGRKIAEGFKRILHE